MENDFTDEHLAELGLAATEPGKAPGPCPDAAELAALQEGRLAPARRGEVLAHLDACSGCMARWLAVSSVVAPEMAVPASRGVSPVFIRAVAVAAAMAACLFLAVRFLPLISDGPDFVQSVDSGYRLVLDDSRLYAELSGPVGEMAASAGMRSADTPAAQAFEAGWRAGVDALRQGKVASTAPSGGERVEYVFSAGRWSALVQAALGAESLPGTDFWMEQERTATLFRDRTSVLASGDVARCRALWTDVASAIGRLAADSGTRPERDRLRRLIRGLGRVMGELELTSE